MAVLTHVLILQIFKCIIGARYFESLPEASAPQFDHHRNAMKMEPYKWPNGVIPYEISDEYSAHEMQSIFKAMQSFHSETCVRFLPKNVANQVESIRFVKGPGCGALVGFRKNRSEPMPVMYDTLCLQMPGAVQHEMFHVVGLFHEHNRPDRDEYLDIFYENVEEQYKSNFIKGSFDYMETFGLPYDYKSLMHYPRNAFAKRGANYTMVAKVDPQMELGQSEGPTFNDWEKVRRMYFCEGTTSAYQVVKFRNG